MSAERAKSAAREHRANSDTSVLGELLARVELDPPSRRLLDEILAECDPFEGSLSAALALALSDDANQDQSKK